MKEKTKIRKKVGARGITLIALIITIIVMLILVAVTVSVALNGGLIGKAQEAKSKTEEAQIQERDLLTGRIKIGNVWYNSIDEYLNNNLSNDNAQEGTWKQNGLEVTNGVDTLKIGETIAYDSGNVKSVSITYEQNGGTSEENNQVLTGTDLEWVVLGANENGQLELISEEPDENNKVYLKGAKGCLNGIDLIDDVCDNLYGKGIGAIGGRNLKIEDFTRVYPISEEEHFELDDGYGDGLEWKWR